MSDPSSVIHVLSARTGDDGVVRLRGTVRTGEAKAGQVYWFAGADGVRHEITVVETAESGRGQSEFVVQGDSASLIRNGSYLYA